MAKMKVGKWEYTEEELEKQYAEAIKQAEEADLTEPRAEEAYYDDESERMVINLKNGCIFSFPPALIKELADASTDDLAKVKVSPYGTSLHWEELNTDYSVPALLSGLFGTRAWMSELGRKGGRASSAAKAAAARANGQKGGRPPRTREIEKHTDKVKLSSLMSQDRGSFKARLLGYSPVYINRAIINSTNFPVDSLDAMRQELEQDLELVVTNQRPKVLRGQFLTHLKPVVSKMTSGLDKTVDFASPDSLKDVEEENYASKPVAA